MNQPIRKMLPAAALSLLCVLGGCERRVVGVKNWRSGRTISGQTVVVQPAAPRRGKGLLAGIGNAMFGWTRAFERKRGREVDIRPGADGDSATSQATIRTAPPPAGPAPNE